MENQIQTQTKSQSSSDSDSDLEAQTNKPCECNHPGNLYIRAVGRVPGPTKPKPGFRVQTTFCVVFGLFDGDGAQQVHANANGQQIPVTLLSYPIDNDVMDSDGNIIISPSGNIIRS